jgi:hypothetical protein
MARCRNVSAVLKNIMQYDYTVDDMGIIKALIQVWDPPTWAGPFTGPTDEYGHRMGNCIYASRFARGVLDLLHVECEVTVCRVQSHVGGKRYGGHSSIGWGDCGSYAVPGPNAIGGHAVVIGIGWLLDVAGQVAGLPAPGLVLAGVTEPGTWHADSKKGAGWTVDYTWAPGLSYEVGREQQWGAGAPARRLAKAVRAVAGPCRKPRAYSAG